MATRRRSRPAYTSTRPALWVGTRSRLSGATARSYGFGPVAMVLSSAWVPASRTATLLPEPSSSYMDT